jgi:hypothetical protein
MRNETNTWDFDFNDADKLLDWCVDKYGMSKYHDDIPWLDFNQDDLGIMGEYQADSNTVIIYPDYIKSYDDLVETIIHEFQHYLQSPMWFERYYNMGHSYDTHPYEIYAETISSNDKKLLLNKA